MKENVDIQTRLKAAMLALLDEKRFEQNQSEPEGVDLFQVA